MRKPAAKPKRPAATPKRRLPARRRSDENTFIGLAIVRDAGNRRMETLIVSDLKVAKAMGLTRQEMALARQVLAGGVRNCKGQSKDGQVMCANMGGCSHNCHLYRAPIPIPSPFKPEDMGENERNWVDKEKGYGYWCGCDDWDD
jgi:hypothetical protein